MRTLLLNLLLLLGCHLLTVVSASHDVTRIVQKVTKDLDAAQLNGVSPKRKRRATPASREISRRNAIFRKSVNEVEGLGYSKEEAIEVVQREVRSTRRRGQKGRGRRPPGFGGHHGSVAMVHGHGIHIRPSYTDDCDQLENPEGVSCNEGDRYRTIDGRCNNLRNPYWGAENIGMRRYLDAEYQDSENIPTGGFTTAEALTYSETRKESTRRRGHGGSHGHGGHGGHGNGHGSSNSNSGSNALPSAREVSLAFHPDVPINSGVVTHMVTQFGQFLDHDITLTPEEEADDCCQHPEEESCFPIALPQNDAFYATISTPQTCLEFSRSTAFCEELSTVREQMNGITAFVDASNVYGSNDETSILLRSGVDGKLLANENTSSYDREMLPEIEGVLTAGDVRALEMPGLATMHTLWLREHNRLASEIKVASGSLNDEEIFQIARKILIAEMQNIVYGEYLPVVLGEQAMRKYDLELPKKQKEFSKYKSNTDPSITNSFATAAYRFGHSMIQGLISMMSTTSASLQSQFQLRDNYFNMQNYLVGRGEGMEQILQGLINQPAQEMDRFVTEDATNFLFREIGHDFGSDLIARNIQRGRDHGLPGYNSWRRFCGLSSISSMSQRPSEIASNQWEVLQTLYSSPDQIDLFTGGLAETPVADGLTGHTFNCIKAKQFASLKDGDRFFFTHSSEAGSLTKGQLKEIRGRRLGDIICDNTGISSVRENVLLVASSSNPLRSCSEARTIRVGEFV